jgi:hypothetical protein
LWPVFFEKFFAKTNGYYDAIDGGVSSEAYDFVLGAPGYTFSPSSIGYTGKSSSISTAATNLFNAVKSNLTATDLYGLGVSDTNTYGLAGDHAYSVLGAYTITNSTGSYNLL